MKNLVLILAFCALSSVVLGDLILWPRPQNYTYGNLTVKIEDPCSIKYIVKGENVPLHVRELIGFQQVHMFRRDAVQSCINHEIYSLNRTKNNSRISAERLLRQEWETHVLNIEIDSMDLVPPQTTDDEEYHVVIHNDTTWQIHARTYAGFAHAMETFSQLIRPEEDDTYTIGNVPIFVHDKPVYQHRGVMIDTSRHFLQIDTIYRTLDAMMYNKMNVLHWHITDADSFPLQLKTYPNLTKQGAFSDRETYSRDDIASIVEYAARRGVSVIPEIDSPGHTWSWGRSDQLKDITLKCDGRYNGQFDPTLNLTYEVIENIMREIHEIFPNSIVHFGGDEVERSCWDQRPSIKQWMNEHNISTYDDLQVYYRQRQKKIWREKISKTKIATYWANKDVNLPVEDDDIIHWWGTTKELIYIKDKPNKIVLSNYDLLYLDVGFGGSLGGSYGQAKTWKDVYSFNPKVEGIKGEVIGATTCLWSEVNSDSTQDNKLWIRSSALAERLWNPQAFKNWPELVERLYLMERLLIRRGIAASPITCELCARQPTTCF